MRTIRKRCFFQFLLLSVMVGGCGGQYTLTGGDHLVVIGAETPVVVRLQRNDFFVLNFPAKGALIRFGIPDGSERAAYADKLGYAGTTMTAPTKPGRYTVRIDHMDSEGEELSGAVSLFVWDPARPVVAVDIDSLPTVISEDAVGARAALKRVTALANIVYLTREPIREHYRLHCRLTLDGYPDGAIIRWTRQRWRIERRGRYKMPKVIVEGKLISQLSEVRKTFPKLSVGICASKLAAEAFADAQMHAVIIGDKAVNVPSLTRHESWEELAIRGI